MRTLKSYRLGRIAVAMLAIASICGLWVASAAAQISLTAIGGSYTQDFNTLALTGTSSTVPAGWAFAETGTSANALYNSGTGSSTTGDTYSFGAAASAERAFGGLLSGSVVPTVGAQFVNNTNNLINSLNIDYTGEQWRLGALSRLDRLDFQYSLDATSLTTGTWVDADALDFTAPVTGPATGALDGNTAPNRTVISSSVGSLSIPNGATFWIRWSDFNPAGADDGLAVDDFSITPQATVPNEQSSFGAVKELYRQ